MDVSKIISLLIVSIIIAHSILNLVLTSSSFRWIPSIQKQTVEVDAQVNIPVEQPSKNININNPSPAARQEGTEDDNGIEIRKLQTQGDDRIKDLQNQFWYLVESSEKPVRKDFENWFREYIKVTDYRDEYRQFYSKYLDNGPGGEDTSVVFARFANLSYFCRQSCNRDLRKLRDFIVNPQNCM